MRATVDRLLEQSNFSLDDLVAKTALNKERVKAIISGRWLPSPAERKAIATALGVNVDDVDWGHTISPRNVRYHRYGLREDF